MIHLRGILQLTSTMQPREVWISDERPTTRTPGVSGHAVRRTGLSQVGVNNRRVKLHNDCRMGYSPKVAGVWMPGRSLERIRYPRRKRSTGEGDDI